MRAGLADIKIEKLDTGSKILWIHAVSVGEVLAVIPMIENIKDFPGIQSGVFSSYNNRA